MNLILVIISRHGIPNVILTYQGLAFPSSLTKELCKLDVTKINTSSSRCVSWNDMYMLKISGMVITDWDKALKLGPHLTPLQISHLPVLVYGRNA